MDLYRLTDRIGRRIEDTVEDLGSALFDPVIRLGVTGLSRAGKTVFITSLVANLIERGRMPQLRAAAEGRIETAYLQPQPDHTLPRFAFEDHLAALAGPEPHWPESTRSISTLRLSLRVARRGLLTGLAGPTVVHLDIVDYPGEWLLDLPLMNLSFTDWSAAAIATARAPARAAQSDAWLARIEACDPAAPLDEAGLPTAPQHGSFEVLVYNRDSEAAETTRIDVPLLGLDGFRRVDQIAQLDQHRDASLIKTLRRFGQR